MATTTPRQMAMLQTPATYQVSGLIVRSEIFLPGATKVPAYTSAVAGDLPDVTIERRSEPVQVADAHIRTAKGEVGRNDFLLRPIDGLALRISNGSRITFNQSRAVSDEQVRLYLLGTAWGVLCHQRRLLPIHASAVVVGGQAVAISAPTGFGKSTLAAALAARGYPVLADDVCVVEFSDEGLPLVHPLPVKGMKLTAEAAREIGLACGTPVPIRDGRSKFYVEVPRVASESPLPLVGFYVLSRPEQSSYSIEQLSGAKLLATVAENIYRLAFIKYIRPPEQCFQQVALTCQHVSAFALNGRPAFCDFKNNLARLEQHMRDTIACKQIGQHRSYGQRRRNHETVT